MQKILIIGSHGFIGNNLSNFFFEKGYDVYKSDIIDCSNQRKYFKINSLNDYKLIFTKYNFQLCVNCSGAASVPNSITSPLNDFRLNTSNVFEILNSIRLYNKDCKFINLSSAAVYGNPLTLPVKETDHINPLSPYGYHKLMSENICKEFSELFSLKTCSLRIFSAYGPGLKKQIFYDLFQKAKENSNIILYGTGNESRDFIFIEDLTKAIWLTFLKTAFKGESINIANGMQVFIKDAVNIFFENYKKEISIKFGGEQRQGDPNNWLANIDVLKSFGYKSNYDLNLGLSKYINWLNSL